MCLGLMLSVFLLCSLWGIPSASLVNTSIGAIFVPRTPVVLRTTDVKTWLFIPFPEGVTINKTQVQDIFEGHWSEVDEILFKYSTSKYVWATPTVLRTILARVLQGSVVTINSRPAGLMPRER